MLRVSRRVRWGILWNLRKTSYVQCYVRQTEQGSAGISDRNSDEEAVHGVFAQSVVVFPRGIFNVICFLDRMFEVLSFIKDHLDVHCFFCMSCCKMLGKTSKDPQRSRHICKAEIGF